MVLIKVEDRDQFGQGNRSRGIAIAQSLSRIGEQYCIISSTRQWFGYLQSEQFHAVLIEEGYDSVAEVKAIKKIFKNVQIYFIVLDGERFDPDYVELLKQNNIRSVILDDVARVNRENAWALINANIYASDDLYEGWNIKKYCGRRYLLLRQLFFNLNQTAPVKNQILLALGVMMGQWGTSEIESRLKRLGYTIQIAAGFSTEQMVKAIDAAHLIICGASVTLHEVWTRHRQALPVYQSRDQILFYEFLKKNNLPQVVSIGRNEADTIDEIVSLAQQTINNNLPQIQLTKTDVDKLFKELIADVA
jgi:spore coat polysaccharide biosynthesis predicted glycosyltransferase SpsG